MRILVVCFSLGGVMRDFFTSTTRHMAEENDVYVLTNAGITWEEVGTKNILCLPYSKKRPIDFLNPLSYYRIKKYIRSIDYDVAFVVNQHILNKFVYHWLDSSKTVTYLHDPLPHSGIPRFSLLAIAGKIVQCDWYKSSRKVVLSSFAVKKAVQNNWPTKDANKFEVIYLGLVESLLFDLPMVNKDIDVLFFGRVEYYKGIDVLIASAEKLRNYNFVIAGKGDLNQLYKIKKLPNNCQRLNRYIPDKELCTLINRSKIVVLPYKDATGTQTIQTAFYYGCPVIATNVGCFPEYITDGEDGLIVPANNSEALKEAIDFVLKDEQMRHRLALNGKEKVKTIFSNDAINNKYMSLFHSIASDTKI